MKTQLVVICLVVAELVLSFPQNWGDPNAVVETIKLQVYEVPPIPSVVAFDFDAARKGKTSDLDERSLNGGSEAKDGKGDEKKDEGAKAMDKPEDKKEEKKEEKPAA